MSDPEMRDFCKNIRKRKKLINKNHDTRRKKKPEIYKKK